MRSQIRKLLLTITRTENWVICDCEKRRVRARNASVWGARAPILGRTFQ